MSLSFNRQSCAGLVIYRQNASDSTVLISYAHRDGAPFAAWLWKRLQKEHPEIALWQGVISDRAGRDWWLQITEALDHVEYMVLVVAPAATRSKLSARNGGTPGKRECMLSPCCALPMSTLPPPDK